MERCEWCGSDPLMVRYHDEEWGREVHDDIKLFEFLILEGAQAGLTWATILKKRGGYRRAFHNFDARKISKYTASDFKRLMSDPGIVRNRLKIESTMQNASAFLRVVDEFGSFDSYIWGFVNGKKMRNKFKKMLDIPARTPESESMSKDLLRRGFRFVGPTICYAFMQAVGMVDDHTVGCHRHGK